MSTKWSTKALNKSSSAVNFDELFKDEYAVILLQGKNLFDDTIYCYVKVDMPNIKQLYASLQSGQNFNPSDFGTVVAAGKGEPTAETKAEISTTYKTLAPIKTVQFPPAKQQPIPTEKKAWDEY